MFLKNMKILLLVAQQRLFIANSAHFVMESVNIIEMFDKIHKTNLLNSHYFQKLKS